MSLHLVWDASPLIHAHRIDRLDVLGYLAQGPPDSAWRNYTTAAVAEELAQHGATVPSWLEIEHVDGLQDLLALATWMGRIATAKHNRGEATVLAWAECHGGIAIVDDADARRVARAHGLKVHGVLWVIAEAVNGGRESIASASSFVDRLIASGARYPFGLTDFESWARSRNLLADCSRSGSEADREWRLVGG